MGEKFQVTHDTGNTFTVLLIKNGNSYIALHIEISNVFLKIHESQDSFLPQNFSVYSIYIHS